MATFISRPAKTLGLKKSNSKNPPNPTMTGTNASPPNATRQTLSSASWIPHWRIIGLINNYSRISFNFGPTLLYWLASHKPQVYESILNADKESIKNFSGHGSAIAQVYNHMIMPLANRRDKETQVKWAIKDFQ